MVKLLTLVACSALLTSFPAIAGATDHRPARPYSKTLTFTLSTPTPGTPGKGLKASPGAKRAAVPRYHFEPAWPRK